MLYKMFIGANNKTKRVETKKAIAFISKSFQGLTAYNSLGYWKGKAEKSLIIEIETTETKKLLKVVKDLTKVLKQQAIGLAKIGKMEFIK